MYNSKPCICVDISKLLEIIITCFSANYFSFFFSCLGCQLLGEYLETVSKDFEGAAKVFQDNCDERKFPRSCLKTGHNKYLGKGKTLEYMCMRD